MRNKHIWTKRLLSFALTLIFSLTLQGISNAEMSKEGVLQGSEHISKHGSSMLKELATFLNLESKVMYDKLQKESLADIAKQQGVERAALKTKVIELMKERAASRPTPLGANMDFSAVADKLIDKKGGWHHGNKRRHGRLANADELSKILKVTPEQLKQSLHSGKSLADIASENGVSVQTVIDQQVKAVTDHLDQRFAEGKLTKESYEERKAKVKDFVTSFVHTRNIELKKNPSKQRSVSQISPEQ
ncbi:hypothetical protein ACK8P5_15220 [Paenibacillus sp. EC2-1]|uniref:hypothetical protein n=1 Tax=Paenibacillus sp. EC2-1 TaxID=3388665 RepID=UPI003BEF2AA9